MSVVQDVEAARQRRGAAPTIGAWGNKERGFAHPVDVDRSPDGEVAVLNRSTSWDAPHGRAVRVTVLDGAGADPAVLQEFSCRGTGPGELLAPVALTVADDGRIAVTDEHTHQVTVFAADGTYLTRWGGEGHAPGRFVRPAGILADGDGVWVVDSGNARLQRLGWDGQTDLVIGSAGLGPGQLRAPWMLRRGPDGSVWVADWGNDRVQALDPEDGRCLAVIGAPGRAPFTRPSAVALDADGWCYVADWGAQRLQVFDVNARRVDIWQGDAGSSSWGDERLAQFPSMAEDRDRAGDPAGERRLGRPTSVQVLPDGRVLVVDTWHHRIQIYERTPASVR